MKAAGEETGVQEQVAPIAYRHPQLPAEDEPTFEGVRRIHALLQAGFLCAVLNDSTLVDTIDAAAQSVIATLPKDNTLPDLLAVLDRALTTGWTTHWKALDR